MNDNYKRIRKEVNNWLSYPTTRIVEEQYDGATNHVNEIVALTAFEIFVQNTNFSKQEIYDLYTDGKMEIFRQRKKV